ncbi:MAG: hypothetical protein J6I84_04365 [Bacilli bacterium]|nr:hypothetical protein [Bacilli bacterium]
MINSFEELTKRLIEIRTDVDDAINTLEQVPSTGPSEYAIYRFKGNKSISIKDYFVDSNIYNGAIWGPEPKLMSELEAEVIIKYLEFSNNDEYKYSIIHLVPGETKTK